jgi:hypothetical protein
MGRPWTRKEESRLLGMVGRGVKQLVAARILGRSLTAVWVKLRKLRAAAGVPREPRRGPGELARAVRLMSGEGVSDGDVARALDVSAAAVRRCRARLGIAPGAGRRPGPLVGWKPGDPGGLKAAVVRLYGAWGMADAEVARRAGVPRQTVTYLRTKLGLPAAGRPGRKGGWG